METNIDYDSFLNWAQDRFGDVKISGNEIQANSIFCTDKIDHKYKLWMNPSGGKNQYPWGCYRCWLTDNMGSLVKLVSIVDHISYEEAEELICGTQSIRTLEQKVEEFFEKKIQETKPETTCELPPGTVLIENLSNKSNWYLKSYVYLLRRKIPLEGFYVCTEGKFIDRIVIPYKDRDGKLVYYNARAISDKNPLRYMKMEGSNVNRSHMLYFYRHPKTKGKLFLTEGEFDTISLNMLGLDAAALGGKSLSDEQVALINGYEVVLALDNDKAGLPAIVSMGSKLLSLGVQASFVRPPLGYKDWNQLYIKKPSESIRDYIAKNTKPFNSFVESLLT